jgi:hypothetical protein
MRQNRLFGNSFFANGLIEFLGIIVRINKGRGEPYRPLAVPVGRGVLVGEAVLP